MITCITMVSYVTTAAIGVFIFIYCMNIIYLNPSFYAHVMNGIVLLVAFILLYTNYSKITRLEPYKLICLTLLLSMSIGIHGLSHLGLEKGHGYNPISLVF